MIPHAAWRDAHPFIPFEDLTLAALLPKVSAKDRLKLKPHLTYHRPVLKLESGLQIEMYYLP